MFPAAIFGMCTICINLMGDGLRDAVDPKSNATLIGGARAWPLLEVKDLKTYFNTRRGVIKAVNGVSYSVEAGRTLGIVGESGSGKSVSAMSILGLVDGNGWIDGGEILFEGTDLTKLSRNEMYTDARQRHLRYLPGADDEPESGVHD